MEKHYVVYDMTSYDERNLDYLQVGIAIKNTANLASAQKYDSCSTFYSSNNYDSSKVNDNFRAPKEGCYRYEDLNPALGADPHPELPEVIMDGKSKAE